MSIKAEIEALLKSRQKAAELAGEQELKEKKEEERRNEKAFSVCTAVFKELKLEEFLKEVNFSFLDGQAKVVFKKMMMTFILHHGSSDSGTENVYYEKPGIYIGLQHLGRSIGMLGLGFKEFCGFFTTEDSNLECLDLTNIELGSRVSFDVDFGGKIIKAQVRQGPFPEERKIPKDFSNISKTINTILAERFIDHFKGISHQS